MNKAVISGLALGLVAAAASGEEARQRELYMGVEPGFMVSDPAGAELVGEQYALGVVLPVRSNWSVATTLSWEERELGFLSPPRGGCIAIFPIPPECLFGTPMHGESEVYALDLVTAYDLDTRSRWQPYVGAGARVDYVDYIDLAASPVDSLALFPPLDVESTFGVSPALALGSSVAIGSRASFRVDGRYYPHSWFEDSEQVPEDTQEDLRSDAALRVGLGWRF